MKIFATLLLLSILAAPTALAAGPEHLGMTRGALVVRDQLLFVSNQPGEDPCERPCSATPFLAPADAVAGGLWTLAPTEGGAQWAYNGARIITQSSKAAAPEPVRSTA